MKAIIILILCAGLFTLSSCKRTYICECTGGFSNQPYNDNVSAKGLEEAERLCEEKNTRQSDTYNCHLK